MRSISSDVLANSCSKILDNVAGLVNTLVGSAIPLSLGKLNRALAVINSELAHGPDTLSSRNPEVAKDATWVEDGDSSDCEDDHGTLEDHEGDLVIGKVSTESVPELCNTVDATHKDQNSGSEQCPLEECESLESAKLVVKWRLSASEGAREPSTTSAKDEVSPKYEEARHSDDLRDQTSNHDVDTALGSCGILSCSGHATTDTLEDEGEHIATNEDVGVHLGLQARVLATDGNDHTSEAQIDTSSKKRGGERQGDQVSVYE